VLAGEPRQHENGDGLRQPVGDLGDDRADGVLAGLVGGQEVPRQHEVEVDEQDEREHGADGVQNVADVRLPVPSRPGPAAQEPPEKGDGRRTGGGAGQRADGVATDHEPHHRPTDADERVGREEPGHGREAPPPLENPETEPVERDTGERDRHEDRRHRRVKVQEHHQQRRGDQRDSGDHPGGHQPERDKPTLALPPGDPQSGDGLHPHGRHRPDDEHGQERPELPERGWHEKPRRDHVEQVGSELVPGNPRGHDKRGHPGRRRHLRGHARDCNPNPRESRVRT